MCIYLLAVASTVLLAVIARRTRGGRRLIIAAAKVLALATFLALVSTSFLNPRLVARF